MKPRAFRSVFKGGKTQGGIYDLPVSLLKDLGIHLEKSCGIFRVYGGETLINLPYEDLGFLSFHFSASKVSTLGADPKLVMGSLLLPKESHLKEKIMDDIEKEAMRYNSKVVINVNESEYLSDPMVSAVAVGETREPLLPTDIKFGDLLVLIGIPGAEFLYTIASKGSGIPEESNLKERISRWRDYKWMLSCLDSSKAILSVSKVKGIVWVGEGGILGSLDKFSRSTGMGFSVWRDYIEFPPELVELCLYLGLDPLAVPSRGSIIAILPKDSPINQLKEVLDAHGYAASSIGSLTRGGRSIVRGDTEWRIS